MNSPQFFLTGGSGFIGLRVVERLLGAHPSARIHVLIRERSVPSFTARIASFAGADRVTPVIGDLTHDGLGIDDPAFAGTTIDHVIHLGAIYDMSADAESQHATNVDGTARVIDFARAHDAMLHHISSIAVSGDHRGRFTEADFDTEQHFPSPYHRTKFESERLVRQAPGLRWRVYRPSIVVGDSRTGVMDKVDGPYYFFGHLAALGALPSGIRVPLPDLGDTNIVPVDYVADAITALCTEHPDRTGLVFHLSDPRRRSIVDLYNALAPAFDGPRGVSIVPHRVVGPLIALAGSRPLRGGRDLIAVQFGIPPAVLDAVSFTADFRSDTTTRTLENLGVELPDLREYAPALWRYWQRELDPGRHRRTDPRGPLVGKKILITGGSRGIGKATARMCVARGADVILVARDPAELSQAVADLGEVTGKDGINAGRAYAYPCDITDEESVATLVKSVLAEHDHIDILVNNAGRSIRRATMNSLDRAHDYQRVMAVNYFGAVNLIRGLLPHMVERQSGHIVNVTSIAVQTHMPRFAAYSASKAALEAFSESTSAETLSDHVTFSNVRLPLVRTTMISPTDAYDDQPGVWSVDKAAARVLRGIVDRPPRVSSPLGDLAEFGRHLAPRLTRRVLHQDFLTVGESAAAQGNSHTRKP